MAELQEHGVKHEESKYDPTSWTNSSRGYTCECGFEGSAKAMKTHLQEKADEIEARLDAAHKRMSTRFNKTVDEALTQGMNEQDALMQGADFIASWTTKYPALAKELAARVARKQVTQAVIDLMGSAVGVTVIDGLTGQVLTSNHGDEESPLDALYKRMMEEL